jgi:energy-coupling factor transporter ATP-binding protein EcfA2
MAVSTPLARALEMPWGARFRRCALQVNPYPYLRRSGQTPSYASADEYNAAIVNACLDHGIELIGITDHDATDDAGLRAAAENKGIVAFPGVELCSSEGVHVLVLFDPSTQEPTLGDFLGWCEVDRTTGPTDDCRPCGKTLVQILREARSRDAVTITPHVTRDKGLLTVLSGQPLVKAWATDDLLAVAIPGPVEHLGQRERKIVRAQDPNFARDTRIAVVNANDVRGPEALARPGAWTWVKTATDSIEGLRQAFLDPESRVRLPSDPEPDQHAELVAIAWNGGFFDDGGLRLNENLNVLIGGRGAGKSTIVESLRYALGSEPTGENAKKAHHGFVDNVLGEGTTVQLLVRSTSPDERRYIIQRTAPHAPEVLTETGERLSLQPRHVLPEAEVYGQHELAELADHRQRRTALLRRFVKQDPNADTERIRLRRELTRSREQIEALLNDREAVEEDLQRLPALEEQLQRFEASGVEDRLQQQARFGREGTLLDRVDELVQEIAEHVTALGEAVPFDREFLSDRAIEDLPSLDLLNQANEALAELEQGVEEQRKKLDSELANARTRLTEVRNAWQERRTQAQQAYEAALRQLDVGADDARRFVELRKTVERLQPLRQRLGRIDTALEAAQRERRALLEQLTELHQRDAEAHRKAAKSVSQELSDLVRVEFRPAADRQPVERFLREQVGGRLDAVCQAIHEVSVFSPVELASRCRAGSDAVRELLPRATPNQADRLCQTLTESELMRLEEIELDGDLNVELNVAATGADPTWRNLDQLSTGQKATALLLMLLLESQSRDPLVVDQPEDDLDNAFISGGVVPRIRRSKRRRQFVFTTHNANLPVLGDAELIAVVRAKGEADQGRGSISCSDTGAIDSPRVRQLVEELLEGGRKAFETRRRKYQF